MAGLDYFLNTKWVDKISKSNETNLYITDIPSTITSRFNFNFKNQVEFDRYLYDYSRAYSINSDSKAIKELDILDIEALLLIDGNLSEIDPRTLRSKIEEIMNGRKPKGKDERKIWNILEVINLMKEPKFLVDENNFELFIHIIFRNVGYDLDSKRSFYRDLNTKSPFQNLVNVAMIDSELDTLITHISDLNNDDISGFTQASLIFLGFIFINPYKEFNIIVAYLLMKWWLMRTAPDFMYLISTHKLMLNWKKFTEAINRSFETNFNIDEPMEMIKEFWKAKINEVYRLNLLNDLIYEKKKIDKNIFTDVFDKIFIVNAMGYNTKEWKLNRIKTDFTLKNKLHMEDKEIMADLKRLAKVNLVKIEQSGPNMKVSFANKELEKARYILKD